MTDPITITVTTAALALAAAFVAGVWAGRLYQAYKLVRAVHNDPAAVLAWFRKVVREADRYRNKGD